MQVIFLFFEAFQRRLHDLIQPTLLDPEGFNPLIKLRPPNQNFTF
jgi:hypothetical protein